MAKIDDIIPFIIKWESGTTRRMGESLDSLFNRAKRRGISNDPDDAGGLTIVGVTYGTYKNYCNSIGCLNPTEDMFYNIDYKDWLSILKKLYWDRWLADKINNQSVANILVDWVWASGVYGIKIPQRILGVVDDGIVGRKTIGALNEYIDQSELFIKIRKARADFIDDIVRRRPKNLKFKKGWLNRLNDIKYKE